MNREQSASQTEGAMELLAALAGGESVLQHRVQLPAGNQATGEHVGRILIGDPLQRSGKIRSRRVALDVQQGPRPRDPFARTVEEPQYIRGMRAGRFGGTGRFSFAV